MFVEKRPNGNYRFGEWYIDSLTGKRRRAYVTYTKNTRVTRKQAEEELREKIAKLQNRTANQRPITLQEAFDEFLDEYQNRYAYYTIIAYHSLKSICSRDFSADALLENITRPDIVKWAEHLLYQENKANGTVRTYLGRLSSIYSWASKRGYIPEDCNPVVISDITWKNDRSKASLEEKFLSDEELETIFDYSKKNYPFMYDFLKILYLTGLRVGEAGGMEVKNYIQKDGVWGLEVTGTLVDLTNQVAKSLGLSNKKTKVAPKTKSSNRFVSLPKSGREIVEKNIAGKDLTDLIFTRRYKHRPITEGYCVKYFRRLYKLGITKRRIHAHMFRHTHVSKLAEKGVPLYAIQDRLGHSSSKTTEEIYLHVTNKVKKDLLDKLEDL